MEKSDQLFNELDPNFNMFNEKRKRHSYNGEENLDADNTIKENPIKSTEELKREPIRRRLIKKRVKYREKQKKKKALREELRMKEDGCLMSIRLEVKGRGIIRKMSYPKEVLRQQQVHYMV
jgi:hypothetical protein